MCTHPLGLLFVCICRHIDLLKICLLNMVKMTFCPLDDIFIILYLKEIRRCSRVLAGPCWKTKTGLSVIFYWLAPCSNDVCQWDAVTSGLCERRGKGNSRGNCTRATQEIDVTKKLESHFWKAHKKICMKISKSRFTFWTENRISDVPVSPSKWKFEYLYFDDDDDDNNNKARVLSLILKQKVFCFGFVLFLEWKF